MVADLVHEKYPNITVTVENTDWTSYWTKLPVELASGNAPDLIYMHFSRASDYTNSMLPISDYIEKDEDINIDDELKVKLSKGYTKCVVKEVVSDE